MVTISNQKSSKIAPILTVIIGCSCVLSIVNLQLPRVKQLTQANPDIASYFETEKAEKVKLEFLATAPTFGFDNLAASWSMLQFLQYFGDGEARKATGYLLSPQYLETIVKKDPRFTKAYLIISPASSMFAGRPDRTVALFEEGLKNLSPDLPQAYFVWLYKGIDEVLYIGDLQKAKKSYEKAAEWAKIAGDEFIEKSARDTAQFLATNPDARQAQVAAWFMLWLNVSDEQTKALAKMQIEKLGGELEIYPDGRVVARPPKPANS